MNPKLMQVLMKAVQNGTIGKIKNIVRLVTFAIVCLITMVIGLIAWIEPWGSSWTKEGVVAIFFIGLMCCRKVILDKAKPLFEMVESMSGMMGGFGGDVLSGLGSMMSSMTKSPETVKPESVMEKSNIKDAEIIEEVVTVKVEKENSPSEQSHEKTIDIHEQLKDIDMNELQKQMSGMDLSKLMKQMENVDMSAVMKQMENMDISKIAKQMEGLNMSNFGNMFASPPKETIVKKDKS